jgi:hypothetical protein
MLLLLQAEENEDQVKFTVVTGELVQMPDGSRALGRVRCTSSSGAEVRLRFGFGCYLLATGEYWGGWREAVPHGLPKGGVHRGV